MTAELKSCCDYHADIDCQQGKFCPVRASTTWCETSRQPCTQPYTCAGGCQIKSYNAALDPVYVWSITPMGWVFLAGLMCWVLASAVYFYWG